MTRASISLGLGTNGHSPARGCIEKADSICEGRGLYRRAAEVNAVEASFPVESSTWLSWLLRRYGKKVKRELVILGTAGMAVYFFFVFTAIRIYCILRFYCISTLIIGEMNSGICSTILVTGAQKFPPYLRLHSVFNYPFILN